MNALVINPSKFNVDVLSGRVAGLGQTRNGLWIVMQLLVQDPKHLGIMLDQRSNWCDTADHRFSRITVAQSSVSHPQAERVVHQL